MVFSHTPTQPVGSQLPDQGLNPENSQEIIFKCKYVSNKASLMAQRVKNLPVMWKTWVRSLGQEDPLEKGMAAHSSILAWRIPWAEEPGELQSVVLQRDNSLHLRSHKCVSHSVVSDSLQSHEL